MSIPNGKTSYKDTIEYFTSQTWGGVHEADKYWDDEDLYDNFIIFYVHAFAYLNLPRPTKAQLEMALFTADRSNKFRMLMAMRGLSKSLTSQLYVVWRLLNDPNEKILVMSGGAARAVNYTQFIQKLLKELPICNGMAPRHNKERTSSQSFDVAGADASDSPSVYAVGAGNQISGFRATMIVYDDIETPQNSGSAILKEKLDHYASEAFNLLMSGREEALVLCTPHSIDSLYIDWIINKGFRHLVIPAEYPEDISVYNGGLAPYILERMEDNPSLVGTNVDERMDMEFIYLRKLAKGKSQYKLQYMLDVTASDELKHPLKLSDLIVMDIDEDDAPIKISPSSMKENLVFIKHNGFSTDRLYAPSYVSDQRAEYSYRVMSIDPSGRGKDETGIAIAYTLGGRIFIKKCSGMTGGYEYDTLAQIANMCKDHRIDYLVIESNFGDGAFAKMLEPILAKISPNTGIEEVRATARKETRVIGTLEPLLNQRKLVIDKKVLDDDISANMVNSLTYQLTRITIDAGSLRHDDRIDALEMVCRFLIERENFDEEAVSSKFEQEKLEQDLEEMLKVFDMYSSGGLNYCDVF